MAAEFRFQAATQNAKGNGQVPVLQGLRVIEPTRLTFQQSQIMHRVEDRLPATPMTRMTGHQLVVTDQSYFIDRGHDRDLTMRVLSWHRVVVGLKSYQRQRSGIRMIDTMPSKV